MKIEDDEFRELFYSDSLEHIKNIETVIIELENKPQDLELLKSIFRDAHSMKGAAGLLNLKGIESITHVLEDLLGRASKGEVAYKPEEADRIYFVLDQLRLLVEESYTGKKANVDIKKTLDTLRGTISIEKENTHKSPKIPNRRVAEPVKPDEDSIGKNLSIAPPPIPLKGFETPIIKEDSKQITQKEKANSPSKFKIETMRVDPAKLDGLLSYSGELIVVKNRIQKRVKDVSELNLLVADFTKILKSLKGIGLEEKQKWDLVIQKIASLKVKSTQDSTKLDLIAGKLDDGIRNVRLVTLSSVLDIFPRTVRDICRELGKEAYLTIEGGQVTVDKLIAEEIRDPLTHLIRNSLDHGIETSEEREILGKASTAKIIIFAKMINNSVCIQIQDDGRGLDLEKIKAKALENGIFLQHELDDLNENQIKEIIFHPGFSTRSEVSNISGRGIGMDVVKTFVEKFKGTIEIYSEYGVGTKFSIKLPLNFSTNHALIVQLEGWKYGIPTEYIEQSLFVKKELISLVEGKPVITFNNEPIRLVYLSDYFPVRFSNEAILTKKNILESCIILRYNADKVGIIVDSIVDKQEILIKPFSGLLTSVSKLAGTTILESGEICYMIQISDFFSAIKGRLITRELKDSEISLKHTKTILVVEDSLVTRAQIQRILEDNGYTVATAFDGQDGYEKLQKMEVSLLLTDIDMPRKDGLTLVKEVRSMSKYKELPILILTSLGSEEQIRKGKEAGANGYLIKSQFDQLLLLQTVERLLL